MTKIFAVLLFLYAGWQIYTFTNAPSSGQGLGQIFWALVAILGGMFLWKKTDEISDDKDTA